MGNQTQFLLDSGFWGWLYKLLYPVEWLMTQIMSLFHKFLVMLGMNPVGFSWVMSIVFLVLVVQACIFPLFYKTMKSMRKMQEIQPKMMRIQNKYKNKTDQASKEAMQREMMKLYQDNDANPMGSCLPMLIQGPVFMCMFYTLSAIPYIARGTFRNGGTLGAFDIPTAKEFTSTTVFGVNVADNFTTAAPAGKVVIGIFVALMCFCLWLMQYNSMKRNMAQNGPQNKQTEMMQKMMLWMFPIMYIFSGVAMHSLCSCIGSPTTSATCCVPSGRSTSSQLRDPRPLRRRRSVTTSTRTSAVPRPVFRPSRRRSWRRPARLRKVAKRTATSVISRAVKRKRSE